MSQAGVYASSGGGGGTVITLTGNTGGPVPSTASNINVVGDGVTVSVVGNPGTSTLTISSSDKAVTYVNSTPYIVLPTDYLLDVDSSGAPITIQLPDVPVEGQAFVVKDLTGSAATNNITVTTVSGGTNIDGATTYTMATNYLSIQVTGNSQGTYDISLGYNPGGGIGTLAGDTGTATGSTVTISTGYVTGPLSSGTINFSGSGSDLSLSVSDSGVNTGLGTSCLAANNPFNGTANTAVGSNAGLLLNGSSGNSMYGYGSCVSFIGQGADVGNCAFGYLSLFQLVSGDNNLAIGSSAGSALTGSESSNVYLNSPGVLGESFTLRIGSGTGSSANTQELNAAYISGIRLAAIAGTAVLVSASDQLGIAVSSARFKQEVEDMGESSDIIHKLRPVTFKWDRTSSIGLQDAPIERQFGLIAEEVAEVIPQIVSFDKEGRALSVNYSDLISLLVNETQRLQSYCYALEERITELEDFSSSI